MIEINDGLLFTIRQIISNMDRVSNNGECNFTYVSQDYKSTDLCIKRDNDLFSVVIDKNVKITATKDYWLNEIKEGGKNGNLI